MKVSLLCIGKTNSRDLQNLIDEYQKRLPKHIGFEIVEIPYVKNVKNLSSAEIKKLEFQNLEKFLGNGETLILLDEKGKEFTSRQFAKEMQNFENRAVQKLVFVIGGAFGFDEGIKKLNPQYMSLSKMTFNHQMVRLFFVEQLYRAYSIIEGKPYHND